MQYCDRPYHSADNPSQIITWQNMYIPDAGGELGLLGDDDSEGGDELDLDSEEPPLSDGGFEGGLGGAGKGAALSEPPPSDGGLDPC